MGQNVRSVELAGNPAFAFAPAFGFVGMKGGCGVFVGFGREVGLREGTASADGFFSSIRRRFSASYSSLPISLWSFVIRKHLAVNTSSAVSSVVEPSSAHPGGGWSGGRGRRPTPVLTDGLGFVPKPRAAPRAGAGHPSCNSSSDDSTTMGPASAIAVRTSVRKTGLAGRRRTSLDQFHQSGPRQAVSGQTSYTSCAQYEMQLQRGICGRRVPPWSCKAGRANTEQQPIWHNTGQAKTGREQQPMLRKTGPTQKGQSLTRHGPLATTWETANATRTWPLKCLEAAGCRCFSWYVGSKHIADTKTHFGSEKVTK